MQPSVVHANMLYLQCSMHSCIRAVATVNEHSNITEMLQLISSMQLSASIVDMFMMLLQFSKSIVFEVYSSFVNNFLLAMQQTKKNARSKPAFAEFLKVSHQKLSEVIDILHYIASYSIESIFQKFRSSYRTSLKMNESQVFSNYQLVMNHLSHLKYIILKNKVISEPHGFKRQRWSWYLQPCVSSGMLQYLLTNPQGWVISYITYGDDLPIPAYSN